MNDDDSNDYLTRLFDYMRLTTPKAILEAERAMLLEEVKKITAERDAAVASTVAAFEPELTFRRERLSVIEGKIAGEQVSLFKVVQLPHNFNEAMKVTVEDGPFNAAMNYAAKYPASQEPTGPVIPCSTDNVKANDKAQKTDGFHSTFNALSDWLDNNPEAMYHVPKNAQVVTHDGQTFFVFKSAGYKAIAERLGFPYRPVVGGHRQYMLTPKEYDEVFKADQLRKCERT